MVPRNREMGRLIAIGQVGIEMAAPIGLGWFLDTYFGTLPWLIVAGAVLGSPLPASDIAALVDHCEGWPAGVHLASLSLRHAPDRHAAVESLVLLRNDGTLPLAPTTRVAVLGPAADDERLLQGDYSYPAHTEIVQPRDAGGQLVDGGAYAAGPYYPSAVTPLAGIRAVAGDGVAFARGCGIEHAATDTRTIAA